jgi:uncharacterized protein
MDTKQMPAGDAAAGATTRRKPGPKPGTENAKHGGQAAATKYGRAFYSRIGKLGGAHVKEWYGSEHYARVGKVGGETTRERHGTEHYSRIGKIGGKAGGRRRPKRTEEA